MIKTALRLALSVGLSLLALIGCKEPKSGIVFTNPTAITNLYFPLAGLNVDTLEGIEGDDTVLVVRTLKTGTKEFTFDGKPLLCLIVEDREFVNGEIEELTLDYFAQADDSTVYYFGEDVDNYEDGQVVGHEGAWLFGVQTTKFCIKMTGNPKVGDKFQAKNLPGIITEDDSVMSDAETVTVPVGTYNNCLKIKETVSDGEVEYKYYAPNVGVIKEVSPDGELNLKSHR